MIASVPVSSMSSRRAPSLGWFDRPASIGREGEDRVPRGIAVLPVYRPITLTNAAAWWRSSSPADIATRTSTHSPILLAGKRGSPAAVSHARHQGGEACPSFGDIDGSNIRRLVDYDVGGFRR